MPNYWALASFNSLSPEAKNIVTDTLLKSLDTNYQLIHISSLDDCDMKEEDKSSITMSLSRNLTIKQANISFIAFLQGLNQKGSQVSWLLGVVWIFASLF